MIIKRLEITSFGKWNRETINFSEGLNVLHGPNEIGKSSIRLFITYILFGLGAQERERYTSNIDGQLGGKIYISDSNQEWVIERYAHRQRGHRVGYLDGQKVDDEDIKQLLNGVDRFLFESIFSFQDRDLHAIRYKNPEDVGKVLFNLGLTGSDRIVNLENKLNKKVEELYKKRGKKPLLNAKLSELKQLNEEIQQASEKEWAHQKLNEEVQELETKVTEIEEQERALSNKLSHHQSLLQTKSAIINYQLLNSEMKEMQQAKDFPEDGLKNFQQLKEKKLGFQEKKNVTQSKLEQLRKEQKELQSESRQADFDSSLDEIEEMIDESIQLSNKYDELEKELRNKEVEFTQVTDDLDLDLSVKEVLDINLSIYTEETWKRISTENHQVKNEKEKINNKKEAKKDDLRNLTKEKENLSQRMMDPEQVDMLKSKEQKIKELKAARSIEEQYQQSIRDREQSLESFERLFAILKPVVPAVLFIILIGFIFIGFSPSVLSYVIVAVLLSATISSYVFFHKQKQKLRRGLQQESEPKEYQREELDDLEEITQKLKQQSSKQKQLEEMELKIKYLEADLKDVEQDEAYILNQENELHESIDNEKSKYPFLLQYEFYQWPSVFEKLNQLKQIAKAIDAYEKQHTEVEESMKKLEANGAHAINQNHETFSWAETKKVLDSEKSINDRLKDLTNWFKQLNSELNEIEAAYEPYEKELQQLLEKAGVEDEVSFEALAEQHEAFLKKNQQLNDAYHYVYEVFGQKTDEIISQNFNWHLLEEKTGEMKSQSQSFLDERGELQQLKSDKKAEVKQLEEGGRLSDLIHRQSMLEEEIKQLADEWAVARTAQGLLEDTKSRYQNVYLPGMIERSTQLFRDITNEKYLDIQFSYEEESLFVQDRNNDWYHVQQLSEGTADQLYVSLRFAMNETLNHDSPVPFILDDAFVHFDAERKALMMRQLEEQAMKQQILYFTCHDVSPHVQQPSHTIALSLN